MSSVSPYTSSGEHTPHRTSPIKTSEGSYASVRMLRAPLSELPVANFVSRPASPSKSHTSPSKANKLLGSPAGFPRTARSSSPGRALASASASPFAHPAAAASISRPGSAGSASASDSSSSNVAASKRGESLFAAARVKATALADLPLEQSPEINRKRQEEGRRAAKSRSSPARKDARPADVSPKSRLVTPTLHSPQKRQSAVLEAGTLENVALAPPSLARKKERVKASEATSLLLDEDEDAVAGSPRPAKSKRAEHSGFARPMASSSSSLVSPRRKKSPPAWTVLTDEEIAAEALNADRCALSAPHDDDVWTAADVREDEKENVKPDPIVIQGRRKGTGGRLSLVATGSQVEGTEAGDASIASTSNARQANG